MRGARSAPSGGRRGQSEAIGVVLLLGLTMISTTAIVGLGSDALSETQQSADVGRTEQAMTQLDSRASLVGLGSSTSQRVDVPTSGRGSVRVHEDRGSLTVKMTNRSANGTGATTTSTIRLGTIEYEQGETTIAYQGGGVWKRTADGATMVSPPEFHYRTEGQREPTLTLPLVTVRGTASGSSLHLSRSDGTRSVFPTENETNPLENSEVEITVESRYYRAWGRFFEDRTSGAITYDHSNRTVTIELVAPNDASRVSSPVVSDAGTIALSNSGTIDSYNSSVGNYGSSGPNDSASVIVDGDFTPANGVVVKGNVRAAGNAQVSNHIAVHGTTYVDGSSTVYNTPEFYGTYSTGGDLDAWGSMQFYDDVIVGGDLTQFGKVTVGSADGSGDLHVGDDATINQNTHIRGDLVVGGDLESIRQATVDGNVYVAGDATLGSGTEIGGDVVAGGAVTGDTKNVGGTVSSGTVPPKSPRAPLEAGVRMPPSAAGAIATTESQLAADNDNDAEGVPIEGRSLTNCDSTCTLSAGSYYLDSIDLRKETLRFDTTEGDITLYVDESVEMSGDAVIDVVNASGGVGPGEVSIYLAGNLRMSNDANVAVPGDRAPHFWVYMNPGSSAELSNTAQFRGVIYGPGSSTGSGTRFSVSNKVQVFGALIGEVGSSSNANGIHYDEALRDELALGGDEDVPRIAYLHISQSNVTVTGR